MLFLSMTLKGNPVKNRSSARYCKIRLHLLGEVLDAATTIPLLEWEGLKNQVRRPA